MAIDLLKCAVMYHQKLKIQHFLSVFAGQIPYTGRKAISSLDLRDHLCIGRDTQYCYTFICCLEMFKDKEKG